MKPTPPVKPGFLLFLLSLLLVAGSCGGPGHDPASPEVPGQPNVLVILVDDLGYNDVGFMGSRYYQTPNLDRLAASSTVFTAGYAGSRVCSPSRASLLTGQFAARHGITDWIGAPSGEAWRSMGRHNKVLPADYRTELNAADTTLAEAFREAGYRTFFAGKWHLGGAGSLPGDHGFETNIGGWEKGSPMGGYYAPWENPFLQPGPAGENLTLRLARETASFIDTHRDEPFLAFLSFYAVHGPIQTTRERWKKYRDRADSLGVAASAYKMGTFLPVRQVQDNPVYAGLVETMDEAVGIVLDQLRASGLDRNTLVLFTSDNGGVVAGDSYSTSLLPLRGGKGYPYEGGIRVPFLVHRPGQQNPQSVSIPVTGSDIYPTLLDLAGLPLKPGQHLDGRSLKPLLRGGEPGNWGTRPLIWHYPHYGNQGGEPSSAIRVGDWKLIRFYEDGRRELYHLETDLEEAQNLVADEPERAATLDSLLNEYLSAQEALYPVPDPQYDPLAEQEYLRRIEGEFLPRKEAERLEMLRESFDPGNGWWGSDVPDHTGGIPD